MKGLLFTYALSYGGAVVSLFRPFHGLLIYACFAILKPEALWYWSVPEGNYSRLIFAALFIGWAVSGFGSWRFGRARPVAFAIIFYPLWVGVSALGASNKDMAFFMFEQTLKVALPIIIGLTLVDSMQKLKQLAWVIVLSHGFLAVEFNLSYYSGFNRLVQTGFAGMDEKSVALTMVIGASAALFLALNAQRWVVKAVVAGLAVLMLHVPLFTFSRSGMLGLVASGATAFWLVPKRLAHIGGVLLVVALGFGLAGPEVREKFSTSFAERDVRDASAQSRLDLWQQAWDTMLQFPVAGVGPRQWGLRAKEHYGWGSDKEVHNTWLQTGAELGFPGLLALVSFFLITCLRLLPIARSRPGPTLTDDEINYARMVICALVGFGVASQFITVYGIEVPYYIAMVGAGLLKLRAVASTTAVPFAQLVTPTVFESNQPGVAALPRRAGT